MSDLNQTEIELRETVKRWCEKLTNPPFVNAESGDEIDEKLYCEAEADEDGDREEWDGDDTGIFYTESGEEIEVERWGIQSFEHYSTEYAVSGDLSFLGAEIMVQGGGPSVYIDTRRDVVIGAWWGDRFEWSFTDNIGLNDYCEENFNMAIEAKAMR
ncbi:hypothetical protein RPALISO_242 [Ruegeria phage RpAliso]|nr:hypothetical protein RPALISO_242 [Ruegeria phage RpAliso]